MFQKGRYEFILEAYPLIFGQCESNEALGDYACVQEYLGKAKSATYVANTVSYSNIAN